MNDVARLIRHTIKASQQRKKFAEGGVPDYDPMSGVQVGGNASERPALDPQSRWSKFASRLTGTQFGEPRYQTWPEKMVRSGVSLAGDVLSGEQAVQPPGLRREDFTDTPPPSAPTDDSTWLGRKLGIAPGGWQPNDPMMERAQDMAGLAGGQTLLTGAREASGYRPVNPSRAEVDHQPQVAYKPNHEPDQIQPAAAGQTEGDVGRGVAGALGGDDGLQQARLAAQRRAAGREPVAGLPTQEQIVNGQLYAPGPYGPAHDVAERYMASRPEPTYHKHPEKYHEIDKEHSAAIARAYDEMVHAPNDPAVKSSYEALIRETLAQYQAIKESGLNITPVGAADYPYHGNPRAVAHDVAENNHMAFFKTSEGFGSDGLPPDPHHPMMQSSGEKIGDHDMLNNDIFRVVHDYFGHIKNGYGFRATGEDNAWRSHAAMYSDLARPAMTTETRGQNSWVNYGPHGEKNRTASGADTIYADQKIGLMPEWTMRDRGSPEPIIAYHGSPHSFDRFDPAKIGGGEGNQAYGQGLYFAEHSPVSEWYRYQLAARRDPLLEKYGLNSEDGAHLGIRLAAHKGDTNQLIADTMEGLQRLRAEGRTDLATKNMIKNREAQIAYLQDPGRAQGHLYQVAIDHPPETFLDWDKPLREQPKSVQKFFKKEFDIPLTSRRPVGDLYDNAVSARGSKWISNALKEAGVPGVRYRDQASRAISAPDHLVSQAEDMGARMDALRSVPAEKHTPETMAEYDRLHAAKAAVHQQIKDFQAANATHNYVTFDAPRLLRRDDGPTPGKQLLEDSSATGAPLAALEQQRVPMPAGLRKQKPYYEGPPATNAGVDARPDKSIQTVADPHRMMFPGIYRNPKLIAEEAAARVGQEDPAMKQLFGVSRGDLRDMAVGRVGNEEPNLALAKNPRGSLAAQNIQTPHNTQRLVDTLIEAGKHEGLRTADAWYIMDPMYQRMKELYGPEQAAIRFRHLNTTTGMASPGSDVLTEIQRGTGAHWLQEQGRFSDFTKFGGLTGPARQSPKVPSDVRYIQGHPYHRTSQTAPMQKYFDTGSIQTDAAKVPLYVHASGVPETGFQTSGPVGDAHFSRGVGLADTRKGPTDVGSSFSKPEYQTLQPWWKDEVAGAAGLESVPAQARLWTTLGPQTGVESELGAPKLELFSKQIMKAARRLGVSPEKARDMILSGKAGAGARGGVASSFAPGGRVGYEDGGMTNDDAPVFDPTKLAAVKPAASPVFDPAKLASAKPREGAPMDAMDVVSGAIENAPASAWQFAKDVVRPVTHPIETLGGIKDLGLGLLEKSGAIGTIFPSAGGGHEQTADAMGQYLKNRYGGLENIKKTMAKDPVGALSDASMVLTGGGSAAARLPGALGRAGEITGAVGRAVDPILAPVNAARAGTKVVGELMTHTGATPLENAYRAGVEGGEAGEVFRGQMRGTSEMAEPVQMAKEGLEGYRGVRARDYREGRDAITSLDRQMAPQDRVLDFGKIDDAVDKARKVQTFGTRVLDKGANDVRNSMISEINEWKALDPVEYHTIDGMDALKRSLGHMMMDTAPGTSARKAAGDIYNAVRKTIVEYDPKYARVMKDYEQASIQIKELERAMSLGEKASGDTALRKLQSIMRNNVNTNYGRRLELGKLLEENGATHLMAALSGQALNAWAPRGLGKLGAELAVIGGAGHFISPWTLAATPLMSPRLMGEVSHGVGRTVGRALEKTNKSLSSVGLGGNRTAGNVSYRLGRSTNPFENETNPYAP